MAGAADQARFDAAHRALLADKRIQFELPAKAPEPPPPDWLVRFFDWLGDLFKRLGDAGPVAQVIFWLIVAGVVVMILYALWPLAKRLWSRLRGGAEAEPEDWRPEAAPARALLAEADALAARGDYAEAAHLVLLRSVEQIGSRRPHFVRPALTSRDIARIDGLPGDVARAFTQIAGVVETGLFAARPVGAEAWAQCRAAYEAVAFPKSWVAA